jgi:glycosyltransferase involved in cell wall biosynthesis
MITQAYLPHVGGAERQLSSLVPLLRKRGVEVDILTRRYAGLSTYEEIDGSPVHRFPVPGPKAIAMLSFVSRSILKLGSLRPDLIHAHELLSPATIAIVAKRFYGMPVVAKVLRGGQLGDVEKLKSRPMGGLRLTMLNRGIDAFVTISREIDDELNNLGIEPSRREWVPNGVDTNRFSPVSLDEKRALRDKLGLSVGAPLTVFIGRLVPEKQIDRLVEAWPQVRKQVPGAELLVIGSGILETRLQELASEGIQIPGQMEDVCPYLQAADVFVLPSSTEGLSNSMLEALSTGLGVVVTSVGGAPDVIIDGQDGLLVSPDDISELIDAVVKLLKDDDLRLRLGDSGRRVIGGKYSLTQTADQLVGLYLRLIEGLHT